MGERTKGPKKSGETILLIILGIDEGSLIDPWHIGMAYYSEIPHIMSYVVRWMLQRTFQIANPIALIGLC